MWAMIAMGVLSGIGGYAANKIAKANAKMAENQAITNAKLSLLNFSRRAAYRNEELGQQVWNIAQEGQELIGAQKATMGASMFDVSTGDRRILLDSLLRNLEKRAGVNRTYQLQNIEDEIQTQNDIIQYNFDAYSQRQIAKQYSGWRGAVRVGMAAGTGALGAYQPSGKKGGINSNTGASSSTPYPARLSTNSQLQSYLDSSTKLQF